MIHKNSSSTIFSTALKMLESFQTLYIFLKSTKSRKLIKQNITFRKKKNVILIKQIFSHVKWAFFFSDIIKLTSLANKDKATTTQNRENFFPKIPIQSHFSFAEKYRQK